MPDLSPHVAHAIRETTGALALFAASASVVIRWMISHGSAAPEKHAQRIGTVAGILLLIGVGWGQFTHPYAPLTLSGWLIVAGVALSNVTLVMVWRSAVLGKVERRGRRKGD